MTDCSLPADTFQKSKFQFSVNLHPDVLFSVLHGLRMDYVDLLFFCKWTCDCFRKIPKSYIVYHCAAEHEFPHFGHCRQNYLLEQVTSHLTIVMADQVCSGLRFLEMLEINRILGRLKRRTKNSPSSKTQRLVVCHVSTATRTSLTTKSM